MHAPTGYTCPFCALATKTHSDGLLSSEDDVFYRDSRIMAFVSSHTWLGSEWNSIVIPIEHYENIYDLPNDLLADIAVLSRRIAMLYKECFAVDGVTVRQHNEPAGNQDVWHYHMHVMPRTAGVSLYGAHEERIRQNREDADKIVSAFREAFGRNSH